MGEDGTVTFTPSELGSVSEAAIDRDSGAVTPTSTSAIIKDTHHDTTSQVTALDLDERVFGSISSRCSSLCHIAPEGHSRSTNRKRARCEAA